MATLLYMYLAGLFASWPWIVDTPLTLVEKLVGNFLWPVVTIVVIYRRIVNAH